MTQCFYAKRVVRLEALALPCRNSSSTAVSRGRSPWCLERWSFAGALHRFGCGRDHHGA